MFEGQKITENRFNLIKDSWNLSIESLNGRYESKSSFQNQESKVHKFLWIAVTVELSLSKYLSSITSKDVYFTIFTVFGLIRKKVLSLAASATGAGKLEEISQAFVEVWPIIIPDICYFCYTGKILGAKILHRKRRKLQKIGFCGKIAEIVVYSDTNCENYTQFVK